MGRFLLPWFGGSAEVWTGCMLFFQLLLLAGYAYAHLGSRFLRARHHAVIHIILSVLALFSLPIIPAGQMQPASGDEPLTKILLVLMMTVGMPYFLLASTGPLLQRWYAGLTGSRRVYGLYSVSNLASMLALVSFPLLFEPHLSRAATAYTWGGALLLFAALNIGCALMLLRKGGDLKIQEAEDQKAPERKISRVPYLLWVALAAAASMELLAVTNKITLDLAVVPILWILPLVIYLLTFIICFAGRGFYNRGVFTVLFMVAIVAAVFVRANELELGAGHVIGVYCFLLFTLCMVCHGELYASRPEPRHLTGYYLCISIGGAVGGAMVAVIAPLIFNSYLELWLGVLGACLFIMFAQPTSSKKQSRRRNALAVVVIFTAGIALFGHNKRGADNERAIYANRNFYGVVTIWEKYGDQPDQRRILMQHGTTFHGVQFTDPVKSGWATAYYGPQSGVGLLLNSLDKSSLDIGAVGLGAGTICTYLKPEDTITFYEINPEVIAQAKQRFTFLHNCKGAVDVVQGDARLSLERTDRKFDILVLDAFSSDAVPVHLLTKEAFNVYLSRLRPGGVIAAHISTVHLDLQSVVWKLAEHFGLQSIWIESNEDPDRAVYSADWILLTNSNIVLTDPVILSSSTPKRPGRKDIDLWTDDHINLLQILDRTLK